MLGGAKAIGGTKYHCEKFEKGQQSLDGRTHFLPYGTKYLDRRSVQFATNLMFDLRAKKEKMRRQKKKFKAPPKSQWNMDFKIPMFGQNLTV
mgnify:FL=1